MAKTAQRVMDEGINQRPNQIIAEFNRLSRILNGQSPTPLSVCIRHIQQLKLIPLEWSFIQLTQARVRVGEVVIESETVLNPLKTLQKHWKAAPEGPIKVALGRLYLEGLLTRYIAEKKGEIAQSPVLNRITSLFGGASLTVEAQKLEIAQQLLANLDSKDALAGVTVSASAYNGDLARYLDMHSYLGGAVISVQRDDNSAVVDDPTSSDAEGNDSSTESSVELSNMKTR
ncbi:MAG: hypothetical protein A3J38_09540 [Gammaproteobacteria bacterium RIFCSPHIGHO2_12_FULL_45_9]|nr:MAG: hypothetical protein A3J38_09540 [Gammaproteobacteria bacterium RIFCSPHIGHO2_12_FULL_45_9]